MRALAACVVAVCAAGCGSPGAYTCTTSAECVSHGANGTCEAQGYCSFPDSTCASGRRFEPNAGGGLGGTCATGVVVDAPLSDGPRDAHGDAGIDAMPVAISFKQVNAGKTTTATTQQLAFTQDVAAHDAVIVAFDFNSAGTPSVTDSQGNTYLPMVGPMTNGSVRVAIYAAFDAVGGPDTVSVSLTVAPSSFLELYIHEYAGVIAFDTGAGGTGTSAATDAMASGGAMTRYPNELIFGFGTTGTASVGTGFTLRSSFNSNVSEDQLAATPGIYQTTATMTAGSGWTMLMGAFRGY